MRGREVGGVAVVVSVVSVLVGALACGSDSDTQYGNSDMLPHFALPPPPGGGHQGGGGGGSDAGDGDGGGGGQGDAACDAAAEGASGFAALYAVYFGPSTLGSCSGPGSCHQDGVGTSGFTCGSSATECCAGFQSYGPSA